MTKDLEKSKILEFIKKFVKLLARKNALKFSKRIIDEFKKYYNKQNGILEIEVKSVKGLETDFEKKLKEKFKKSWKVAEVDLKSLIDKSLIGGLVLGIDDMIIDGSLKGNLKKIKEKMI
jgi:F-type H+-transporting ATPase subunit delta